jgi:FKBP-type peptidyl-prolyl cis-trans isomerase
MRRFAALTVALLVLAATTMAKETTGTMTNDEKATGSVKKVKLPGGTVYEDLVLGAGAEAVKGKTITVHYTGMLTNGSVFDSSHKRNKPFQLPLGAGKVIKGWDEGLVGMKVGGKRRLTIPPEQGYGPGGFPPVIPPNATLIFETELIDVK